MHFYLLTRKTRDAGSPMSLDLGGKRHGGFNHIDVIINLRVRVTIYVLKYPSTEKYRLLETTVNLAAV